MMRACPATGTRMPRFTETLNAAVGGQLDLGRRHDGKGCLTVDPLPCLARNGSHWNLYGSVTTARMIWLCIAGDHQYSALHSRRLEIRYKSNVIMVLRYARTIDCDRQLCKQRVSERPATRRCPAATGRPPR